MPRLRILFAQTAIEGFFILGCNASTSGNGGAGGVASNAIAGAGGTSNYLVATGSDDATGSVSVGAHSGGFGSATTSISQSSAASSTSAWSSSASGSGSSTSGSSTSGSSTSASSTSASSTSASSTSASSGSGSSTSASSGSGSSTSASSGSGGGGPLAPLTFSGIVTDATGAAVADAHVALFQNSAVSADTAPDGSFVLVANDPWGVSVPPLFPTTRPIEHTIIASKSGYFTTYRGVPGSQALGLSVTMRTAIPQTTGPPLAAPSVAEYLDERVAAVTMTFDDTKVSQLTVARPLFDQYGYKASFYLTSASIGAGMDTDWPDWQAVHAAGHEIGNHGRVHWVKIPCSPENDAWNWDVMYGGFVDIQAHIGAPPLTFAYPGGGQDPCNEPMVIQSGHVDFRRNDHLVSTDRLYPEGDTLTPADGINDINTVIAHTPNWNGALLSWFLFYMHDVTVDRVTVLSAMLDDISANDALVWCAGYGEVTVYEREREQSTLTVSQWGPRSVTFTLTNGLDPTIFNEPLTVSIPLPTNAGSVQAALVRDGSSPRSRVFVRGDHLFVDAVPGATAIHVSW